MEKGTTLTRLIIEEQRKYPQATGDFTELLTELTTASKLVAREVNKAGLAEILGLSGRTNIHGEAVQKLDEFAHSTIIKMVDHSGHLAGLASEEMEGIYTMMVYTTGQGVHGFTLDPTIGEFLLSHENMTIPPRGKAYSVNEGNYMLWNRSIQRYIDFLKTEDKASGRPYKGRYIGSLVSDFYRNLLKGGIFLYPGDTKSPQGKLRLLYEASPLAFIAEQAGGRASTGQRRILDIQPRALHQRVPLIIGSAEDVKQAEEFCQSQ